MSVIEKTAWGYFLGTQWAMSDLWQQKQCPGVCMEVPRTEEKKNSQHFFWVH